MLSGKVLVIVNICLAFSAVILLLTFLGVKLPTVGQAMYLFNQESAYCVVSYKEHTAWLDLERCCPELQQQLVKGERISRQIPMEGKEITLTKRYYTGRSAVEYFINQKAYWYCRNDGYQVG